MRRIGWKVLLCSLPIVLPMFVAAAFILSLVQIPLQQWFEPAGEEFKDFFKEIWNAVFG